MAKPPQKSGSSKPTKAESKATKKPVAKPDAQPKDETKAKAAPEPKSQSKPKRPRRPRVPKAVEKGRSQKGAAQTQADKAPPPATISQDAAATAGLWALDPSDAKADKAGSADKSEPKSTRAKSADKAKTPIAKDQVGAKVATIFASRRKAQPTQKQQRPKLPFVDALNRHVDRSAVWLTQIFTTLARVRLIAAALVALVAVLAFTPGFTTIPPVDRDESRFAQASRQMVATSEYVDIRFQNEPRYQKPIGIYWLQSAALHVYGAQDGQAPIWVYRTVSFAGAVAAALLIYWLALGFGPPTVAFAAALLMATTILLGAEARLAKTDAMLFATILLAQAMLAKAFLGRRDSAVKWWHAFLFWTAAAAGILIKGPILPMVVASTVVAVSLIDRRIAWLRRLRPGLGMMWMLLLAVPWFVAIGITSAGEFFEQSIGRDLFEKIGQSRERPFVPPGAFAFGFFPTLGWPLAPLAFLAIPFAIASWSDKSTRFLVAWIVPTWLIFEFSATKLPHYILPIYPALAILAARMLVYEKLPEGWLAGLAKGLFLLIPLAAVIAMPITLFLYGDSISPLGTLLTLMGLLVLIWAFALILRSHARASLVATIAGTLVLYAGVFGSHIPAARTIWITPQLVAALDAVQCADPELATLGYNEPSLVLMTRTDLRMAGSSEAIVEFLREGGCRAAFVDEPFVEAVFEGLNATVGSSSVRLVARVEGININGGDALNLHVLAAGE